MLAKGARLLVSQLVSSLGRTFTPAAGNQLIVLVGRAVLLVQPGLESAWLIQTDYLEVFLSNDIPLIDLTNTSSENWYNSKVELYCCLEDREVACYFGSEKIVMHGESPEGQTLGFHLTSPLPRECWQTLNLGSPFAVDYNYSPARLSQVAAIVEDAYKTNLSVPFRASVLNYSGNRLTLYSSGHLGSLVYTSAEASRAQIISLQQGNNDNQIELFPIPGREPAEIFRKQILPLDMACHIFLRYLANGEDAFAGFYLIEQ